MNLTYNDARPLAFFLAFLLTIAIINCCAYAYWDATVSKELTPFGSAEWVSIRWNRNVRDYLRENGYVSNTVSEDELEYICELTKQLSSYYDNIPSHLALSVIAIESSFDTNCEYDGALGLMQLLPRYHAERLIQCLEEDEQYSDKLFYNPRLNIMTGFDYLSQLINECNGDISYALMCYNQGPSSAYKTYMESNITSNYAKNILNLSEELSEL